MQYEKCEVGEMHSIKTAFGKRLLAAGLILSVVLCGICPAKAAFEQKERILVVDLTKGYYEYTSGGETDYSYEKELYQKALYNVFAELFDGRCKGTEGGCYSCSCDIDLDKDGTVDIRGGVYDDSYFSELAGRVFFIPVSGGSIRGEVSFALKENTSLYDTVRFVFPDKPVQKSFKISVQSGKAVTADGKEVTSAAPGTKLTIVPEALNGKFVSAWNSDLVGKISRLDLDYRYWKDGVSFCMPAADVTLTANTKPQEELTFNLTKGFCVMDEDGWDQPNLFDIKIGSGKKERIESGETLDIDGNGSADVMAYNLYEGILSDQPTRVFFIPLATNSISGEYMTRGTSTAGYWPYLFEFPQETKKAYRITVEGGHAVDGNGKTITEAAPGQKVRIVRDEPKDGQFLDTVFHSDPQYVDLEIDPADIPVWIKDEFLMPACDITYSAVSDRKAGILEIAFESYGELYWAKIPEDVRNAFSLASEEVVLFTDLVKCFRTFGLYRNEEWITVNRTSSVDETCKPESFSFVPAKPFVTSMDTITSVVVKFPGCGEIYDVKCDAPNTHVFLSSIGDVMNDPVTGSAAGQKLVVDGSQIVPPAGCLLKGFQAEGVTFTNYTETNCWEFTMPSHAVTIVPVFEENPEPVVMPTETPGEPAVTAAPTAVPDDGRKADTKAENSFNWLYVIIPGGVVLLGGAAVCFARKKRNHKDEGINETDEKDA